MLGAEIKSEELQRFAIQNVGFAPLVAYIQVCVRSCPNHFSFDKMAGNHKFHTATVVRTDI